MGGGHKGRRYPEPQFDRFLGGYGRAEERPYSGLGPSTSKRSCSSIFSCASNRAARASSWARFDVSNAFASS